MFTEAAQRIGFSMSDLFSVLMFLCISRVLLVRRCIFGIELGVLCFVVHVGVHASKNPLVGFSGFLS
jgi:hypothetical protein